MKALLILLYFAFLSFIGLQGQSQECKYILSGINNRVYTQTDEYPKPKKGVNEIFVVFSKRYKPDSNSVRLGFGFELFISSRGVLIAASIIGKTPKEYDNEEKEAIQIIKRIRRWHPAKCQGKAVNFLMRLPVKLELS
jgi:hypothetical protein